MRGPRRSTGCFRNCYFPLAFSGDARTCSSHSTAVDSRPNARSVTWLLNAGAIVAHALSAAKHASPLFQVKVPPRSIYQARVFNPGTCAKCASLVANGKSCCLATAAIQRSLSGMGLPSRASSAFTWPYIFAAFLDDPFHFVGFFRREASERAGESRFPFYLADRLEPPDETRGHCQPVRRQGLQVLEDVIERAHNS